VFLLILIELKFIYHKIMFFQKCLIIKQFFLPLGVLQNYSWNFHDDTKFLLNLFIQKIDSSFIGGSIISIIFGVLFFLSNLNHDKKLVYNKLFY